MHSSSGIVIFSLSENLRNQKTAFLSESRFYQQMGNYFQACFMMFLYSLFR